MSWNFIIIMNVKMRAKFEHLLFTPIVRKLSKMFFNK